MLGRFSVYGFLKNQRYFEPFLILAFLDKGLSFTLIGLLIAFREVWVNILEVPSGALADLYGRKRAMIISFCSYIVSFVVFGLAGSFWLLLTAMFFFAVGEAFRTGTHKAMIFSWLRAQNRTDERTKIYGYTRSWSKIGSAVSVVLAAVFVFVSDSYTTVFFFSAIPYVAGVVNFLGYPDYLERAAQPAKRKVFSHLWHTCQNVFTTAGLRRLLWESMGFEGLFKATKDYLQPVLQATAVVLTAGLVAARGLSEPQKTALLVGPVYMVLHILSAGASRNAHRLVARAGSEERTARQIWLAVCVLFAALVPALYFSLYPVIICGFIVLHVLQDLWRPVLISRFDSEGDEFEGATLLSLENQAKSLGTMALAPLLGFSVDLVEKHGIRGSFWPVAAVGLVIALGFRLSARNAKRS